MPATLVKAFGHIMPRPSRAQLDAGNYPKERLSFQGLPVTVENPRGSIRSGRSRAGREWQIAMQHHCGYIRGTEGTDGDHYDVFVGPNAHATHAYIVTTMAPPTFTRTDEQKAMLGFASLEEARAAYLAHYDDPRFLGAIQAMPMDEFKAKVRQTREGNGLVKGFVRGYERRTAGGRLVFVAPYTNRRAAARPDDTPDLFSTGAQDAGPGPGGAGGQDHGLPGEEGPAQDAGDLWAVLAERGSIGRATAEGLRARAQEYGWPPAFQDALATSIAALPPAMRAWIDAKPDAFRVMYRASLDDIQEGFRATFASAAAVTVNHSRIEFHTDRYPTPEVLRHEMVHLNWYALDGYGSGWRRRAGAAEGVVHAAVDDGTRKGEAILAWAHSRAMRAKEPARPEGMDGLDWALMAHKAESLRGDLRRWGKKIADGSMTGHGLTQVLELHLAIPSMEGPKIARHLGLADASPTHEQLIEMWTFAAAARRLGVELTGEYAREEMAAYKAGVDPEFAERLFGTLTAQEAPMTKAILFLKAKIPGGAAGDLFGEQVMVEGHTRGGTYVAPYRATRQKKAWAAPESATRRYWPQDKGAPSPKAIADSFYLPISRNPLVYPHIPDEAIKVAAGGDEQAIRDATWIATNSNTPHLAYASNQDRKMVLGLLLGRWPGNIEAVRKIAAQEGHAPAPASRTNGEMRDHMLTADEPTYMRELVELAHRRLAAGGQFHVANSLRTTRFTHPDHKTALEYRDGQVMMRQGSKWVSLGKVGQSIDSLASSLGVPTTYERTAHAVEKAEAEDPGGKKRRAAMVEHARALAPFFAAHDKARDAWGASGSVEHERALDAAQRDVQDAGLKRGLDRYGVGAARDIYDEQQEAAAAPEPDWRDEENWHARTQARMKTLTDDELRYIAKDAAEAAAAMPDGKKAGQHADEAHYAGMELRSRAQARDKQQERRRAENEARIRELEHNQAADDAAKRGDLAAWEEHTRHAGRARMDQTEARTAHLADKPKVPAARFWTSPDGKHQRIYVPSGKRGRDVVLARRPDGSFSLDAPNANHGGEQARAAFQAWWNDLARRAGKDYLDAGTTPFDDVVRLMGAQPKGTLVAPMPVPDADPMARARALKAEYEADYERINRNHHTRNGFIAKIRAAAAKTQDGTDAATMLDIIATRAGLEAHHKGLPFKPAPE